MQEDCNLGPALAKKKKIAELILKTLKAKRTRSMALVVECLQQAQGPSLIPSTIKDRQMTDRR
jgi:hypothetical protein